MKILSKHDFATCNLINNMILLLIIASLLFGCTKKEAQQEIVELNFEESIYNFKQLKISDLNCEVSYVPLETDSIFFKAATRSDFSSDYIVVSDMSVCLLYNNHGNFISRIGKNGKGPGEFVRVSYVQFGPDQDIYINDGSYISIYDLKGKFKGKFKPESNPEKVVLGGNINTFSLFNDSLFIGQIRNDSGLEKYKAVFFNKTGRAIHSVVNHRFLNMSQSRSSTVNGEANIYKQGGATYIKERLVDTIFRITDKYQFKPVYHINLGKLGIPNEVRELPMRQYYKKKMEYYEISRVFETSEFLFLSCSFNNNYPLKNRENLNLRGTRPNWAFGILGVYDKRDNELFFIGANTIGTFLTLAGLENDYDGGISFYPKMQVNDSTLAMWVDAYLLKEHVDSDYFKNSTPKYPEKKKELEKLANSLSENDNPVLILVTFKQ